jgi:hypothetical protein
MNINVAGIELSVPDRSEDGFHFRHLYTGSEHVVKDEKVAAAIAFLYTPEALSARTDAICTRVRKLTAYVKRHDVPSYMRLID